MKRLNPTMQRFTRCMLLILCLSILYVLLMMMAYVIPDSAIMENRNSGIQYLDSEGERPLLIFRSASSMMDNFTDKLMLTRSVNEQEMRLISRAMFPNYARYWNGYQVLLRPLLMVANYSQIRTLINAVCIFLLIAVFCQIRKSINTWIASAFVLSMLLVRFIVVSVSMQYASCFIIMMIAMIVMLRGLDKGMSETKLCLLFTVVGSVTNFVDLLTVPAITVGVPAVAFVAWHMENGGFSWKKQFMSLVRIAFYWLMGYGITWALKWLYATLILGKNIFAQAMEQMAFRTNGTERYPGNRILAIKQNLYCEEYLYQIIKLFSGVLIIEIVVDFALHRSVKKMGWLKGISLLVLLAGMPYVWYMVLGNHSLLHNWFTYRLQIVTAFGLGCSVFYGIQNSAIGRRLKRSAQSAKPARKRRAPVSTD